VDVFFERQPPAGEARSIVFVNDSHPPARRADGNTRRNTKATKNAKEKKC
jgi:hypothetical protein